MTNKEIYQMLDKIGCMTFSTIDGEEVQSRIAHFYAYDDDGFYFRTMFNKPFAKQLNAHNTLAVCGMSSRTQIQSHDAKGLPKFDGGYSIRLTGDVKRISADIIAIKAKTDEAFQTSVTDREKYPAIIDFCLYRGKGEIFDFDFELKARENKLERTRFCFGDNYSYKMGGCFITDECISCGACKDVCTFLSITEGSPYVIDPVRCDECGSCILVCPVNAIREGEGF